VAIAMSAASILNTLLIARAALALVDHGRPTGEDRRTLMRRALPLGVVSFSSSIYFSVDLVLLGWLTDAHSLGEYAAACKILNLLVILPALLMSAALPGLATTAGDPAALGVLVSRIWHWLAVVGVPVCAAAAVFAKPIVAVAFGPSYSGAVPLVRILALAAAVALLTNVLVTMLIARSTIRVMVIGNAAAIALNVVGNVVLVPSYGVAAAAWLTVATELFVCVIALGALHRLLPATRALSVTARPALAVAAFVATGVALAPWPVVGIPIATAVFVLLVVALRAWPNELHLPRWRATRP
jgi:O-antigen/teichoic acid export membrane protein